MKKFILRTVVLILVAAMSIIGISYSQKYLYRILSSDYNRHAVIFDVLKGKLASENIIVFGESQTMSGVDTRIIKDILNFKGEIYNLASPAQDLYESSYYYSFLNSKTRIVIQCVSSSFFSKDVKHRLSIDHAISMFLSGYRINIETKQLIGNYNRFFDRHPLVNYFESRTIFKAYIHNMIRPILDNERYDESARYSVYFPHLYLTNKQPNYDNLVKYNCDIFKSIEKPVSQLLFLSDVKKFFSNRGITYVLVLMPVNPDECKECYKDFKIYKRIIEEETNIKVIDLSNFILDTNLFYDRAHLNKKGANLVSSEIAKQLIQ